MIILSKSLRARAAAELRFLRATMTPKQRRARRARNKWIKEKAQSAYARMQDKIAEMLIEAYAPKEAP